VGHDHRGLLTVCSPLAEVQGVEDVTLSVPHLLGGEGSLATLPLRLSDEENEALQRSAHVIRDALDAYDASR
jgi:L-lactate dehydrogenase